MIFYDYKHNIVKDNTIFESDISRKIKATINFVAKDSFLLTLSNNTNTFYKREISSSDILPEKQFNLIIRSDAFYWNEDPALNPYVVLQEDDDLIYFIENCSDLFDINFCPRIQLYLTKNNDFIIKTNILTLYDNIVSVKDTNKTFSEIIQEYDPNYSPEIRRIRKALRKQTEPRVSLAYLEAQIDILSQLLFLILKEIPTIKEKALTLFPELEQIQNTLEDTYVTNIKSISNCIKEIKDNKTKIREVQEKYYAIKTNV